MTKTKKKFLSVFVILILLLQPLAIQNVSATWGDGVTENPNIPESIHSFIRISFPPTVSDEELIETHKAELFSWLDTTDRIYLYDRIGPGTSRKPYNLFYILLHSKNEDFKAELESRIINYIDKIPEQENGEKLWFFNLYDLVSDSLRTKLTGILSEFTKDEKIITDAFKDEGGWEITKSGILYGFNLHITPGTLYRFTYQYVPVDLPNDASREITDIFRKIYHISSHRDSVGSDILPNMGQTLWKALLTSLIGTEYNTNLNEQQIKNVMDDVLFSSNGQDITSVTEAFYIISTLYKNKMSVIVDHLISKIMDSTLYKDGPDHIGKVEFTNEYLTILSENLFSSFVQEEIFTKTLDALKSLSRNPSDTLRDSKIIITRSSGIVSDSIGLKPLLMNNLRAQDYQSLESSMRSMKKLITEISASQSTDLDLYRQTLLEVIKALPIGVGESEIYTELFNYIKNTANKDRTKILDILAKMNKLDRSYPLKPILEQIIQNTNDPDFELISKSIETLGYIGDANTIQILENLKTKINGDTPIAWLDSLALDVIDTYSGYAVRLIDDAIKRIGGVPGIKEDTKQAPIPKEVACPPGQNPGSGNQIGVSGNQVGQLGNIILVDSSGNVRLVSSINSKSISSEATAGGTIATEGLVRTVSSGGCTGSSSSGGVTAGLTNDFYQNKCFGLYDVDKATQRIRYNCMERNGVYGVYAQIEHCKCISGSCNSITNVVSIPNTPTVIDSGYEFKEVGASFTKSDTGTTYYSVDYVISGLQSNKVIDFKKIASVTRKYGDSVNAPDGKTYRIVTENSVNIGDVLETDSDYLYKSVPTGALSSQLRTKIINLLGGGQVQPPGPVTPQPLSSIGDCQSPDIITDKESCKNYWIGSVRPLSASQSLRWGFNSICCTNNKNCKNPSLKDAVQKLIDNLLSLWSGKGGDPMSYADILALYEQSKAVLDKESTKSMSKTSSRKMMEPMVKAADELREDKNKEINSELDKMRITAVKQIKDNIERKDFIGLRDFLSDKWPYLDELVSYDVRKELGTIRLTIVREAYDAMYRTRERLVSSLPITNYYDQMTPEGSVVRLQTYDVTGLKNILNQEIIREQTNQGPTWRKWFKDAYIRAIDQAEKINRNVANTVSVMQLVSAMAPDSGINAADLPYITYNLGLGGSYYGDKFSLPISMSYETYRNLNDLSLGTLPKIVEILGLVKAISTALLTPPRIIYDPKGAYKVLTDPSESVHVKVYETVGASGIFATNILYPPSTLIIDPIIFDSMRKDPRVSTNELVVTGAFMALGQGATLRSSALGASSKTASLQYGKLGVSSRMASKVEEFIDEGINFGKVQDDLERLGMMTKDVDGFPIPKKEYASAFYDAIDDIPKATSGKPPPFVNSVSNVRISRGLNVNPLVADGIGGGDTLKMIELPDGRLTTIHIDNAGHGIDATSFSIITNTLIKTNEAKLLTGLSEFVESLESSVKKLNEGKPGSGDFFPSYDISIFDPKTGRVEYTVGGSNCLYKVSKDGGIKEIFPRDPVTRMCNKPLGQTNTGQKILVETTNLVDGESIFAVTDGVIEAFDGARKANKAIENIIKANIGKPTHEIVDIISKATRENAIETIKKIIADPGKYGTMDERVVKFLGDKLNIEKIKRMTVDDIKRNYADAIKEIDFNNIKYAQFDDETVFMLRKIDTSTPLPIRNLPIGNQIVLDIKNLLQKMGTVEETQALRETLTREIGELHENKMKDLLSNKFPNNIIDVELVDVPQGIEKTVVRYKIKIDGQTIVPISRTYNHNAKTVFLDTIGVEQTKQGQGLGSALYDVEMNMYRDLGMDYVMLSSPTNPVTASLQVKNYLSVVENNNGRVAQLLKNEFPPGAGNLVVKTRGYVFPERHYPEIIDLMKRADYTPEEIGLSFGRFGKASSTEIESALRTAGGFADIEIIAISRSIGDALNYADDLIKNGRFTEATDLLLYIKNTLNPVTQETEIVGILDKIAKIEAAQPGGAGKVGLIRAYPKDLRSSQVPQFADLKNQLTGITIGYDRITPTNFRQIFTRDLYAENLLTDPSKFSRGTFGGKAVSLRTGSGSGETIDFLFLTEITTTHHKHALALLVDNAIQSGRLSVLNQQTREAIFMKIILGDFSGASNLLGTDLLSISNSWQFTYKVNSGIEKINMAGLIFDRQTQKLVSLESKVKTADIASFKSAMNYENINRQLEKNFIDQILYSPNYRGIEIPIEYRLPLLTKKMKDMIPKLKSYKTSDINFEDNVYSELVGRGYEGTTDWNEITKVARAMGTTDAPVGIFGLSFQLSPGWAAFAARVKIDPASGTSLFNIRARFYLNAKDQLSAIEIIKEVAKKAEEIGMPFKIKTIADPRKYGRMDNTVLYIEDAHITKAQKIVKDLAEGRQDLFAEQTTLFTKRIANGVGVAEGYAESFHEIRSHVVAEAMRKAERLGITDQESIIPMIFEEMEAEGLNPIMPWLSGKTNIDIFADLVNNP